MARNRQDVTDAELSVLQTLWNRGTATVRELTDALYPRGGASAYATVQKLLDRLEAKECVCRDRQGGVNLFTATVDRNELIGRRLRRVAEQLCDGSLTPILTHLVKTQHLNARERRELRALIEQADRTTGSRK